MHRIQTLITRMTFLKIRQEFITTRSLYTDLLYVTLNLQFFAIFKTNHKIISFGDRVVLFQNHGVVIYGDNIDAGKFKKCGTNWNLLILKLFQFYSSPHFPALFKREITGGVDPFMKKKCIHKKIFFLTTGRISGQNKMSLQFFLWPGFELRLLFSYCGIFPHRELQFSSLYSLECGMSLKYS